MGKKNVLLFIWRFSKSIMLYVFSVVQTKYQVKYIIYKSIKQSTEWPIDITILWDVVVVVVVVDEFDFIVGCLNDYDDFDASSLAMNGYNDICIFFNIFSIFRFIFSSLCSNLVTKVGQITYFFSLVCQTILSITH